MPTQTPSEPVAMLQVDQLEIWRGDRRLVNSLSFVAFPGDIIHVKGPNGSGKTSLLRCLAGLSLPDSGSIQWFGETYRGRVGPQARARCRYVGHQDALKGGLDVRENLASLHALNDESGNVETAIAAAGLGGRAAVPAQRLSAGQRRRAALARLKLSNADAWLLDEPFTALDVAGVAMVVEWLVSQITAGGIVVLTTHQPLPASLQPRVIELGPSP